MYITTISAATNKKKTQTHTQRLILLYTSKVESWISLNSYVFCVEVSYIFFPIFDSSFKTSWWFLIPCCVLEHAYIHATLIFNLESNLMIFELNDHFSPALYVGKRYFFFLYCYSMTTDDVSFTNVFLMCHHLWQFSFHIHINAQRKTHRNHVLFVLTSDTNKIFNHV